MSNPSASDVPARGEAPAHTGAPNRDDVSARSDTPASGRLAHLGLLRFAGTDAPAFLQGQISNDTRRLNEGAPLLAAYSTAQGRVVAVLYLLPHSSGVIAILPREIVSPTLERLRKYLLRAKVKIEDISDQFAVIGQHRLESLADSELPVPQIAQGYVERDGIGVARVGPARAGADAHRYWTVGSTQELVKLGILVQRAPTQHAPAQHDTPESHGNGATERAQQIEHDWRLADIRAGLPQIYAATGEMFVAQMLNLDLIDGISFTKGCFTGQEIIARTQHLGRIKRRMVRLRLPAGSWAIGQPVQLTDGRRGRLTELAQLGSEYEVLAVLNLQSSGATTTPGAGQDTDDPGSGPRVEAIELPLPYSLGAT